jgi:hypothetical protein
MYRLFLRFILASLVITSAVYLYSCAGGGSGSSGFVIEETIISGPHVGEGGNDYDQIFRSLTVDPTNDNIIYVGSEGNGIFRSTDGGSNWTRLRSGLKHGSGSVPAYPEIYSMAIDDSNTSIAYAATTSGPGPSSGDYPSATGGVYKSTDGGEHWTQISGSLSNGASTSITVDGGKLYLGVGGGVVTFSGTDVDGRFFPGGIFTSDNGGATWSEITSLGSLSGSDNTSYWLIVIRGSTIFTSAVATTSSGLNGLIRSIDGGATWSNVLMTSNPVFFGAASDGQTLYANERDAFVAQKSTDSGGSWSTVSGIPGGPMIVSRSNPLLVFYAQNQKLYRSSDGLATDGTLVLPDAGGFIDDIEIGSSGTIYAGARGLNIWKSTDGGLTFSHVANLRDFIGAHP